MVKKIFSKKSGKFNLWRNVSFFLLTQLNDASFKKATPQPRSKLKISKETVQTQSHFKKFHVGKER